MKKLETIDAVIDDLLQNYSIEELKSLMQGLTGDEFAARHHFGFGAAIRNNYGLWQGNQKLLESCEQNHPDDASSKILQKLWQRLCLN